MFSQASCHCLAPVQGAITGYVGSIVRSANVYILRYARAYVQVTPGNCLDQTIQAIFEASHYPLSIIMIGVRYQPV